MNGCVLAAILLIGAAAGLAVYEIVCTWSGAKPSRAATLSPSPDKVSTPLSQPVEKRALLASAAARISAAVNAFAPMTRDEAGLAREKLRRAGMNMEPETWRAVVAVTMVASAAVCLAVCTICSVSGIWSAVLTVGAAVVGYYAAGKFLMFKRDSRCRCVEASLPDAMELLAVALAAGSPVEQCFREVSASLRGPISEEFRLIDQEVNLLGHSRAAALEHFAQRCASQEISAFVGQITQAIDQGSSVSDGLAAQALLAREQAQAAAIEQIRKMPTKLDIVLSACFLPPTVILVLVPTVVKLLAFLNGGMV